MFTCLWQLWDWIDPPLFTTTMESKKLQQLQQANSHLAPIPQTKPPSFHQHGDYRPTRSPVFQNYPQYQSLASNFAQINMTNNPAAEMHAKSFQQGGQQHTMYQDQIYQGSNDKLYHHTQPLPRSQQFPGVHHTSSHVHPATRLQQQFQQLQQEKMQEQLRTEREAIVHQQHTFALRQQMNPPVPSFMQSQTSSMTTLAHQSINNVPQALQHQHQLNQLQNRNLPPSSLNLTNQFQPAQGPLKINNIMQQQGIYHQQQQNNLQFQQQQHQQAIYQQQMKMQMQQQQQQQMNQMMSNNQMQTPNQTPSDSSVPIIQQNIPGQVVNQSVQTQISSSHLKNNNNSNLSNKQSDPQSPQTPVTPITPQTPITPTHQSLERKKSEPVHSIKSPVTKRAPTAPVSICGWLYKQGSEGLKVWRKRWFVLSEYCLFYYKGPEEEKILGSVLLPSYKISPCLNEDKVYRKFAFKCEHTNMRTYVLAAETGESMVQWVKALTMAATMQGSSESESQPSISSNPSGGENSDSGIHTFQSQQSKISVPVGPVTPASDNGHQPLYANAPPKPRRVTDGGYSSPSPENNLVHQPTKSPVPPQDPIYDTRYKQANLAAIRQNAKTPDPTLSLRMQNMRLENNKSPSALKSQTLNYPPVYSSEQQQPQMRTTTEQELYMQKMMLHQQQLQQQKYLGANNTIPMAYNAERRTPDTYGPPRSNMDRRTFGDYEDIYNLHAKQQQQQQQQLQQQQNSDAGSYRRPMSPTRYDNNIQIPPMPSRYTPNFLEQQQQQQQQQQLQHAQQQYPQHVQMRTKNLQSVARPHSADFLEYEARNPVTTRMKAEPAQAPRPKSSLDINRSPQDNVYYSEASYAEKMRQSALYLQNKGHTMPGKIRGDNYLDSFGKSEDQSDLVRANRYDITDEMQGSASVPRVHRANIVNNNKGYPMSPQEQFLRSASARLPKKEDDPNMRDGERKREESMKRLLEWKQRMLQSPLTRKGNQLSLPSGQQTQQQQQLPFSPKSPLTVQQNYQSNYGQNDQPQNKNHALQRSRSDTHANAGYNSYSSDDEASVSVRNIRNIPKVPLTVKPDPNDTLNRSLNQVNGYYDPYGKIGEPMMPVVYMNGHHQSQQPEMQQHQYAVVKKSNSKRDINNLERENPAIFKNFNMSAGDLLNRTHEELILLLIQLRRQNSSTARAIEQCCTEIHDVQNRIRSLEGQARAESVSHLEKLKLQLAELEKQYEKSKPLVNLVDNMVKLGSLYRGGTQHYPNETTTLDRLEFNQRIQERRYLQEEQRQWDRMSPNQNEMQSKVQQLYKLDQLMQEESGTLQTLQRDKEELERALSGLRSKMQNENAPSVAVEAARRQQHILERELSRVHLLLAENSKKLEQTVASNARLEQELLVLRQKLQASRDSKNVVVQSSTAGLGHHSEIVGNHGSGATAVLESELRRVQQLVGDMQRQRQELSQAVRQLTDNSNSIYEEMNKNTSQIKKRTSSHCWTETDLDSMVSFDQNRSDSFSHCSETESIIPLFVDTSSHSSNIVNCSSSSKIADVMNGKLSNGFGEDLIESIALDNDDVLENSVFGNLSNQEKQEIKTVRIVKRESERRQRDRERSGIFSTQNLDQVMEEEAQLFNNALNSNDYNYQRSKSLPRTYLETHEVYRQQQAPVKGPVGSQYSLQDKYNSYYNSVNVTNNNYPVSMIDRTADLYSDANSQVRTEQTIQYTNYYGPSSNSNLSSSNSNSNNGLNKKTESIQSLTKTLGEFSPVFQSEAARQIINEMAGNNSGDDNETSKTSTSNKHRRAVPKEKRRHFTAPHHVNAKSMQTIQSENDMNKNNVSWRARDDLDMDLALRPRINAPDVVRSALGGQREKISENTIDKLFGAPSKILIPERYIPEQPPELSPEEKKRRQEKVEAIKKMLSDTTPTISGNDNALPPSQMSAEKKQREHLLQLNQILAQQVMQMSKIVADALTKQKSQNQNSLTENQRLSENLEIYEIYDDTSCDDEGDTQKAMAVLPSKIAELNQQIDDDLSPDEPLPIYQQRDNFFT